MDESDLEPEETLPRRAIDQLRAGRLELVERSMQIVRLERNVVHPRTAPREKPSDGRVVSGRTDELEPALADEHRRRLDPLFAERLAMLEPCAEEALVRRDCLVEVAHRHAEMMDPAHRGDATRVLESVAHGESAHRADRLRRLGLALHVGK